MISNNTNSNTAPHGPDGRETHDASACTKCAEHASEAQQWQSAYLQLERQFVKLQLRIDEVDTMSSLSRNGSMARSRTATATSTAPKPPPAVQCSDQGVGQGSVCDLVNRNIQTSPEMAPATTDASVSTLAPPAVTDDGVQTDPNQSTFAPYDDDLEEESPQSSELLTVIPPATPTALQSLSSSSSSSWISTTQSAVQTEDHGSQTSCSFLATCASPAAAASADESTVQQVTRRQYRRRPSLARTAGDGSARTRPVSRRIRGLSKRPVKQRPLAAVHSDPEFADYSDVSDHDTSDDADVEPSVTVTSGSDTEGSRAAARSVTPTQRPVGCDDNDDESSSRGEPLEFASDSSMSQPRPPTPPLATKRTRYLQPHQQHAHPSVLATPPISPSDSGGVAHSATTHAPPPSTLTCAPSSQLGAAASDASTRSIAPSSTNITSACIRHSSSSMSISISDSMLSMSDPPLVAVHGPVPESGSPLGMAAPQRGGATTDDDDEDDNAQVDCKQLPLDCAPTLLSLLESPAHSFNVLTVSRTGAGGDSAPATLERSKGDEVPTLSRGTRLEIDLSRLSTITEMSSASVADSPAAVAKSVDASSGTQQYRHEQPPLPLPPMAWPKPPSTTPPPPAPVTTADQVLPAHVPASHVYTSAPVGHRAPLVQLSPPLVAESSPVSRKKSKSKKRSNASSSTSKLGSLMPRRQATNTSTSSSAATVSEIGGARTVTSSEVSLSSASCAAAATAEEHHPKEKNKGWKAVTSFVSKVKDKVRDKVQHKSHSSSSMGKNTVFAAPDAQHHHSPPTSRRSSLAQLVGLGSHHHNHSSAGAAGTAPLSPTSSSVRAVYGPFHHASPAASNATIVSTVLTSDSESTCAPLSPRSVASMGAVAGGSSRGTPRPSGHASMGAAGGAKMYQSQQQAAAGATAYGSSSGGGGASGAVVGRAPPHASGSVSMSAATGGMIAAAAYASHLHQYQQQKHAQQHGQQQGGPASTTTNNLRPWLGPPPLTKANSAPGSPHTAHATLTGAAAGAASSSAPSRHMPQSQSFPELYSLAHAPTPRHTATASVPIMFPKPVKALGTPKVLLSDPLEPSPNMRISMVTLESQPDSTSSRTPSPSLMSLKSDVPLITPENAPPVPPLVDPGISLPRSLHLTDVDGEDEEDDSESDRPLQRTHRPGPGKGEGPPPPEPEVLTLDEVVDQIPVDVRSIASSRISLVMPAPSAGAGAGGGATNHYVHPAAAAAGSA